MAEGPALLFSEFIPLDVERIRLVYLCGKKAIFARMDGYG